MKDTFDLIEKLELETDPPEDGDRLVKTWRSMILLKGNETLNDEWLGERCEEIILDAKANIRIGGDRYREECDVNEKGLSALLRALIKSSNRLSRSEYVAFEKKQSDVKCAELNGTTIKQIEAKLRELRGLPPSVAENSDTKAESLFLENALYLFQKWYDNASLPSPITALVLRASGGGQTATKIMENKTVISQDDFIDLFSAKCREMGLTKGKTIPANALYEIGMQIIPQEMPKNRKEFKDGTRIYAKLRQYASLTGYKKSPKRG